MNEETFTGKNEPGREKEPGRRPETNSAAAAVSVGLALTLAFFAFAYIYGLQIFSPMALAAGILISLILIWALLASVRSRRRGLALDSQVIKLETELSSLGDRFGLLLAETADNEPVARELISSLSHDIRTSLNALSGWAKILERDSISAKLKETALEGIARSIERQSALLDEAAEFLALEERGSLEMSDGIDSGELLSDVVNDITPSAEDRHVVLEFQSCAGKTLVCDEARLRKALNKLLKTVVRLTPIGGKLRVKADKIPEGLRISIRNSVEAESGSFPFRHLPGIKRDPLDTSNGTSGSGLSLAISRRIIEMHGGEVAVDEDVAGLGTEINVRLPDRTS
ncbi:MAG: HAMP domain-containing histidine kinase [Acidobacteriota bacterium]|nr:MAG: HAMP domain-containing histidine kinase [Acidobacteriota bacterium]